ncbi:hypothetical protein D051_0878 [Vibrio parahaemolyticus VPCR-2010]|uniref:hypothetical protein n=1 Tax=Vibrio parahaemolyticus TaxID=670 RepID=UPI00038E6096|nr:hypothetical protein D051_0878 [Vibrio parahaemolyticus VPCR-2010]
MPSTKIIIPGSKVLENVSASFIANKVVAEVKNKYGSDFPCTLKELDDFFAPKKPKLERHTSLSFSKKKDKFRDLMCDLLFDIDGYQAFKGIWHKAFNDALSEFERVTHTLPETMYLSRCDYYHDLVALADDNLDISIGKSGFNNPQSFDLTYENSNLEGDAWRQLSSEETDLVASCYLATNIAIDLGQDIHCRGCLSLDMKECIEYINNTFGLEFIGDYSNFHSTDSNHTSIVIIEAKRPSSIEEVKAEFAKRISLI